MRCGIFSKILLSVSSTGQSRYTISTSLFRQQEQTVISWKCTKNGALSYLSYFPDIQICVVVEPDHLSRFLYMSGLEFSKNTLCQTPYYWHILSSLPNHPGDESYFPKCSSWKFDTITPLTRSHFSKPVGHLDHYEAATLQL